MRASARAANVPISFFMTSPSLVMMLRVFVRRRRIFARQEIRVVLLFGAFAGRLRVEGFHLVEVRGREMLQMTDEVYELPRVDVVRAAAAPRGHARQAHA